MFTKKPKEKEKERRRILTKRKEKLLDKFVKKDYNNDLEEILAKKHFKEEVKNLLLDSLYKTENAYKDYETVKKNVPTVDEYVQNIIQCVKKRCDEIELTKPKYGEKPTFSIDKENKKIICFPSTKLILYALAKIQKYDDIVKVEPDFINYALTDLINNGNCINNIEPIRDFNGFSWNPSSSDINDFYSNLIYQDLNIICDNKLIEEWADNNDDMIDYMELFEEDLEKKYGRKYKKEILELLKTISILIAINNNKTYKEKICKRKKEIQKELNAMNDKINYLNDISKRKKEISKLIREIDIILNNKEKLTKEYEKRNKDLPLNKKIFSKNVLKKVLARERDEYLLKLKEYNDKMNSKNFLYLRNKYEYELTYLKLSETKEIEEEILKIIILLQKRTLQAIKLKIKNASSREEINRIIYELRYFNLISIDRNTRIRDITKLKKMLTKTQAEAIAKAYELKSLKELYKDRTQSIKVLKYIFNLKIIKLEDIGYKILKEKDSFYVQFFDDDVIDEKIKLDTQINKKDLKIRFNKKIKLFDL